MFLVARTILTCFPNMCFYPLSCLLDTLEISDIQWGGMESGGGYLL